MENENITLRISNGVFNYRVGAIILDSERVLMVKNSGTDFYYTVGGRVKFGETAREAVLREVFEETQINFEIDRLAFIHENIFVWQNEPVHEIALFYLMKHNVLANGASDSFSETYGEVALHWLPIGNLQDFMLYPEFFKTELAHISEGVVHFITRDGKTQCE